MREGDEIEEARSRGSGHGVKLQRGWPETSLVRMTGDTKPWKKAKFERSQEFRIRSQVSQEGKILQRPLWFP